MARERDGQLIRTHAHAVIAHTNKSDAATLDIDVDAVRVGIQSVLDEFLDDRGGTLDHFPGGNLVDEFVLENPDRHVRHSRTRACECTGVQGMLGSTAVARASPRRSSAKRVPGGGLDSKNVRMPLKIALASLSCSALVRRRRSSCGFEI